MTADLAEEHSTATLATERLEAEQAERLKLEKEKSELTSRNKHLLQSNERMEMEVLYSRALDMNGAADSDEDGEPSIFKQKYERAIKELEFTKKRLAQQHDDDMEQLMALKKQLEKKVNFGVLLAYCSIPEKVLCRPPYFNDNQTIRDDEVFQLSK